MTLLSQAHLLSCENFLLQRVLDSFAERRIEVKEGIPPLIEALDEAIEVLRVEEEVFELRLLGVRLTYNLLVGMLSLSISVGFAGFANYIGFA